MRERAVISAMRETMERTAGYAAHLATRKRAYPGSKAAAKQDATLKRAQIDAGLAQGRFAEAMADEAAAYHG